MAKWKMRLKPLKNKGSSRCTQWRHQLKDRDAQKYKTLQEKDSQRKRLKRAEKKKMGINSRTERMKKKHEKELHREAQTRYRAKIQTEKKRQKSLRPRDPMTAASSTPTTAPMTTPTSTKSSREYNTKYKRRYRDKLTRQKLSAVRIKDRARKWQQNKKDYSEQKQNSSESIKQLYSSSSISKAAARVSKHLPQSPNKFQMVMQRIAHSLTPQKKKSFSKITKTRKELFNNASTSCLLGVIAELKNARCNAARPARLLTMLSCAKIMKKYRLRYMASSILGVRYKTLLSPSTTSDKALKNQVLNRKSRISQFTRNHDAEVVHFYRESNHTRELPLKKKVTRVKGAVSQLQPGFVLDLPLRQLYEEYLKKYPDKHVGFTKFTKLRPSNVRLPKQADLVTCECVYCVNIDHKINAVRQIVSKGCEVVASKYELVDKVLCKKSPISTFYRPTCLNKSCGKCQDFGATIRDLFKEVQQQLEGKIVAWNEWVRKPVSFKTKEGVLKTTVRRVLESKSGTLDELIKGLINDFENTGQGPFPWHLFIARWQYLQVSELKEHLPPNAILTILDFAQNWTVHFQNEIISACYSKEQVTIHPIVCYYNDPILKTQVRESIVFLSNDLNHDFYAVLAFVKKMYCYLRTERNVVVEREFRFSDGCSAQYKSIGPFLVLQNSAAELNSTVVQNYFGSEHGKYESDGENAITKSAVDRAIITERAVIRNADEMFSYCEKNLSVHDGVSRRVYMLVNDIQHEGYNQGNYRTVKGTRKIHSISSSKKGLKSRPLTCMCPPCLSDSSANCENAVYVDQWTTVELRQKLVRGRVSSDVAIDTTPETNVLTSQSQQTTSSDEKLQFTAGKYVAVKAGQCKWYAGQVMDVDHDSGEAEVNFMRMVSGSGMDKVNNVDFLWPSNKDISWTDFSSMFVIPYPDIIPRGDRSVYRWTKLIINDIESHLKAR